MYNFLDIFSVVCTRSITLCLIPVAMYHITMIVWIFVYVTWCVNIDFFFRLDIKRKLGHWFPYVLPKSISSMPPVQATLDIRHTKNKCFISNCLKNMIFLSKNSPKVFHTHARLVPHNDSIIQFIWLKNYECYRIIKDNGT